MNFDVRSPLYIGRWSTTRILHVKCGIVFHVLINHLYLRHIRVWFDLEQTLKIESCLSFQDGSAAYHWSSDEKCRQNSARDYKLLLSISNMMHTHCSWFNIDNSKNKSYSPIPIISSTVCFELSGYTSLIQMGYMTLNLCSKLIQTLLHVCCKTKFW